MPINPKDYPPNWKAIALEVKEAANWICENCHRPCRRQGESKQEFRNRISVWHQIEFDDKPQRFTLTVAHLNHIPMDCDSLRLGIAHRNNLRAWCSVCHLRYDNKHRTQKRKRYRQLTIFDILGE